MTPRSRRFAVLAALLIGTAAPAWAQTAPTTAQGGDTSTAAVDGSTAVDAAAQQEGLGDIVVTARRKSESLQSVPLTITAITSASLAAKGGNSLGDVAAATPGLNFEAYANGGYPVLTIRGLSQTTITAFENNVASFFGGIYLPRAYMVDVGLAGLERVEVVKGPQSALYGRNAFAGAINYVPVAPPKELTIEGFVTAGSYDRFDYSATLGGPLIEDRLSVIGGFVRSKFDGTWKNAHPNAEADANGTTGRMGGYDNTAYFAAVTVQPVDPLKITVGYNRSEKDTEAQGRYGLSRNAGNGNCSSVGGVLQFYCGELPVNQAIVDPRSQGLHATSDVVRVDASLQLTQALTLKYLFGHVKSSAYSFDQTSINSVNGDTAAGVQFLGLPIGEIKGPSHDVRLEFASGGTNLAIGGYLSNLDDNSITALINQPALGINPITPETPGRIPVTNSFTRIENRSVFGQVSQDLLDGRVNLSAEGRYTEETKRLNDTIARSQNYAKFTFFTPRFSAKFNVTPNNNIYASAAKGVKSGGFNSGAILDNERTFAPEENWTYEIGTKNSFFDNRLVVNLSAFYIDWSALQTLGQSANPAFAGTVTRNIGNVTNRGVELEVSALVTRGLRANLGVSYNDPKYGDDLVDPRYSLLRSAAGVPILVCDGVTCPQDGSIGGNELARQSKLQMTGGLRYDRSVSALDEANVWFDSDVSYKSRQYVDPLLLTWAPSRVLVNAFAGISHGSLTLEAFVRNLLDEKYASAAAYNLSPNTNIRYAVALGERRTFGITARFKY
jgi:iron complex outermembrane receptor protein